LERAEGKKRASKALLSNIEIQGFHMKPSFFKHLIAVIEAKKLTNLVNLQLTNCAIQDPEGHDLCKALILGRDTP